MERFISLIRDIPDATSLLTPNERLAKDSLKVMESLSEDLHQILLTARFDEEQIWGQLSLITKKLLKSLEEDSKREAEIQSNSKHHSKDQEKHFENDESQSKPSEMPSDSLENSEMSESFANSESEVLEKSADFEADSLNSSQNQDFFDPEEMVRFADEGELEKSDQALSVSSENQNSSSSASEPNEANPKYSDFFEDRSEASSEEAPEKVFSLVADEEMQRLEHKMVAEKPWQLKGEIDAKSRPVNSLLDEDLDFEIGRKPVPQTQTKEVTDEIEELIKQRILDMVYDDVKPKKTIEKSLAKTTPEDFMDYEKSKKSLAELYEEDFKKSVLHLPVNTETERAKKEITIVFRKLCYNLDLMSSLNPVPKPVVKDIEIKNANVPALVMEEVLPFAHNTEKAASASQIFDTKNAVTKAKEEFTQSDKNNVRKRHKATLRTRRKERILKIMNKIAQDPKAQKFEYRKMIKEEKAKKELIQRKKQTKTKFTRSSEFFKNFQELNKEIKEKKVKEVKDFKTSKKIKL